MLIGCASFLIALGDLRNLITPLGYWVLWGMWLCFSVVNFDSLEFNEIGKIGDGVIFLFSMGYFLIVLGFMISALVNLDVKTLYQSVKLIIIFLIGFQIFSHSQKIERSDVLFICLITIFISLSLYLLSKFIFTSYYIILGDGRQGSAFAYPGVFWKTGAFFSTIVFGHFLSSANWNFKYLLMYVLGIFVVISDGSRTGFIWIVFSTYVLILIRMVDRNQYFPLYGLIAMVLISIPVTAYLAVKLSEVGDISMLALPLERLSAGDSMRTNMLHDVLIQAEKCFPFGCGFGEAVTETDESPMVIHNAYLALLADAGVLALTGFLIIIIGPFFVLMYEFTQAKNILIGSSSYFTAAAALGIAGFGFTMAIHPFSTEMSEWGLFFLTSSWMFLSSEKMA